jgi:hypothetical protein
MAVEQIRDGRRDRRAIVFRVVAGIAAVPELMFAAIDLPAPWLSRLGVMDYSVFAAPGYTYELHLWHGSQWGAWMGIIVCGSLLMLLRRPREKPLLMQFVVLAIALQALLYNLLAPGFEPFTVVFLVGALVVAASYPDPRRLLTFRSEAQVSRPLLALALAAGGLLALDVARNLRWQFAGGGGEHYDFGHWALAVGVAAVLTLGVLLTASRRPGWRSLGVLVGAAFIYLGLAAVTVPDSGGSWGSAGIIAVLGGLTFLMVIRREAAAVGEVGEAREPAAALAPTAPPVG